MRAKTYFFDTTVYGKVIKVKATPYTIATKETHYRASYNNGPVHLFAWDENLNRIAAIEETLERLSPQIELAIAMGLQSIEHRKAA